MPPGTPRWGTEWKKATARWYNHTLQMSVQGSNMASRYNYLDLDPTYRNVFGLPLMRMTYNFTANDEKLSAHLTTVAHDIARAMGPTHLRRQDAPPGAVFDRALSEHAQHGRRDRWT